MAFSNSSQNPLEQSKNPIINKLKKRQFSSSKEEGELLTQLQLDPPLPYEVLWMLTDINKRYQDVAFKLIEPFKKDASLYRMLMNEIRVKGGMARKSLPRIIGRLNFPEIRTELFNLINSTTEDHRLLALDILGSYPDWEECLGVYKSALKDPVEDIRFKAVQRMAAFVENETIFMILLPLIHDTSDKIRHEVINRFTTLENHPELVEPLFARLPQEPHHIQQTISTFIGRLAQNPALKLEDKIIPVLADEEASSRDMAVKILLAMPNKRDIIKKFLVYTRGIAVWLRDRCFESFGKVASQIADDVVALLDDEDPTIRIESMFLAVYINDARIIPGVSRILKSDLEWWIRISAIEILEKFQKPEVAQLLHELVHDEEVQWAIISALGKVQDFSSIQVLLKFLKTKNKYVRLEVLKALAKFPDISAIPIFIIPFAKKDPDPNVRAAARAVLEKAGKEALEMTVNKGIDREEELESLKNIGIEMEDDELNLKKAEEKEEEKDKVATPNFQAPTTENVGDAPPSNLTSLFSDSKFKKP